MSWGIASEGHISNADLFFNQAVPDERTGLLLAVRDSREPLTVSEIIKRAAVPRRLKPAEATGILDHCVASGMLNAVPPRTAKGKPRYWDRDPNEIARGAILDLVRQAPEPVAAGDVRKQLKLPVMLTPREIAAFLADGATQGKFHEIPAKTAKGGPRYWNRDAIEYARQSILSLLEKKGPSAESAVRSTVKWIGTSEYRRLIEELTGRVPRLGDDLCVTAL